LLQVHRQVDAFVCYGPAVAQRLREKVRVPPHKVKVVPHPADQEFWRPRAMPRERLIASAGMAHRDYPTLVEAARGLDAEVRIAAFSPWVNPRSRTPGMEPPPNVSFTRLSPRELRDLYGRSLFVVVPLTENFGQSGSLVIYESMAMGKAVVTAATAGEKAMGLVEENGTGRYYPPGDVARLREVIKDLLARPEEAERMGEAARKRVESSLNLDRYLDEMAAVILSAASKPGRQV
jgi:glycosyltransferase involved in cell wall biosynthesis